MDIWAKKKDFWTKCYVLIPFSLPELCLLSPAHHGEVEVGFWAGSI